MTDDYRLILKRFDFFDLEYTGGVTESRSESESESESDSDQAENLKNRKKFHLTIAVDTIEEFLAACNIAYQELAKNKVASFKIITWDMYKAVWTGDQAGKNISIYAYKQPHLNWQHILDVITQKLKAANVRPGIRAYFDMPLIYPYWSTRNESSLQEPKKYRGADQLWKDYYSLVTKMSEKENKSAKKRKAEGEQKEHTAIGASETQLEKPFLAFYSTFIGRDKEQNLNTVLKIYDLILQHAYLSSASQPTALEKAIIDLSDGQEVGARRQLLYALGEFQRADNAEKVAAAMERQMAASQRTSSSLTASTSK